MEVDLLFAIFVISHSYIIEFTGGYVVILYIYTLTIIINME